MNIRNIFSLVLTLSLFMAQTTGSVAFAAAQFSNGPAKTSTATNTGKPPALPPNYSDAIKISINDTQSTYVNISIKVRNAWNWVNNWLLSTFGVSLRVIIGTLGRLIVWFLNLSIYTLQYAVYIIQQFLAWQ